MADSGAGSRQARPPIDRARIEAAVRELLAAIGEDPARPGLELTPSRVADAYSEFFSGVGVSTDELLASSEIAGETGELVVMRDLEFRSVCEHHLLPFIGVAHIAYMPRARVVGLGTIARVVEIIASRPQLQERLTEEIADALQKGLDPEGVLVVLDAVQGCVTTRGPRQTRSSTVTVAGRGSLAEPAGRQEALAMVGFPHD